MNKSTQTESHEPIVFNKLIPSLSFRGETFYGINILSKLKKLTLTKTENLHHYTKKLIDEHYSAASVFFNHPVPPTLNIMLNDTNAVFPTRDVEDVGYDLTIIKEFKRYSKNTVIYDTGVCAQLPLGWFGSVHPRSSISKTGYIMSNCTGIIDPGYTSSIKVALTKIDNELPDIVLPCRIAQLVLSPYVNTPTKQINSIIETKRNDGGFGSSGSPETK